MPALAGVLLAFLSIPASTRGQSILSARFGAAVGVNDPATVAVEVKVPLRPRLRVLASVEGYATPGACAQIWPGSFRCSYEGVLVEVGAAIAAVQTKRAYADVTAAGGTFARTSFGEHPAGMLGGSAGAAAGWRPVGPIWLLGSVRGVAIRDRMYGDLFGAGPRLLVASVGLGVTL